MANESVGSAYLSVQFKTDDKAAKSLEKTLEKAGEAGGKSGGQKGGEQLGKGLESAVSTKAIVLGNLISGAITAAASTASAALGDMMQAAFDGFARYEQMAGGAEILFGDSAGQVMANAQKAFETAGMSANDYLQTVNGFSAGLIRSLGGDTAEAARVADMAIRDMSDNVNTFGSDSEMVQRAYMGFMRGNYTMLDNLSLGFAGTKEGMGQLLDAAEQISGVHYDIDSLGDVFEAIHVVQTEFGITGKTAEEAAHTVEGSMASMRAAWANWLTELGKSDGDIESATEALIEAFGNAAQNVVPLVARIIGGMIEGLPEVVAQAAASLPETIGAIFSALFGESIGTGVTDALTQVGEALAPLGEAFAQVGAFAAEVFAQVAAGLETVAPMMQPLFDLIAAVAAVLVEQVLPVIVQILGSAIVEFIAMVVAGIGGLIALLGNLVSFASGIPATIMGAFASLQSTLTGVFTGAADNIRSAFQGVLDFFAGIPGQIVGFFSGIASDIGAAFSGIHLPSLHITGSLNPVDWITTGNMPQIGFYASGGIFDSATLGVFGEAGPEAIVPLSPGRLQPFGEAVKAAMGDGGGTTNVYINGARVNSNEAIEESFYNFMRQLSRLNQMGGVSVG